MGKATRSTKPPVAARVERAEQPRAPLEGDGAASARVEAARSGVRIGPLIALVASSFLVSLLAVFQWMELFVAAAGGKLSCAIDETFDCATVWNSSFSKTIHSVTGIPIAGWGLVWGITAFVLVVMLWVAVTTGATERARRAITAVRLMAAAGVVASIGLFFVTISIGTWCVTCLATYAIVAVFTAGALQLPKATAGATAQDLTKGALTAGFVLLLAFLLLLAPGTKTPGLREKIVPVTPPGGTSGQTPSTNTHVNPATGATAATGAVASTAGSPANEDALSRFLSSLPSDGRQAISDALDAMRRAKVNPGGGWPTRFRHGPPNASVKVVEWTDILCGHCARLSETLEELEPIVPADSLSVEPRQFPLDGTCNPRVQVKRAEEQGVRCVAAKALICLETKGGFWQAQRRMFAEQERLTPDRVMSIAADASKVAKGDLEACIKSPETDKKLAEDVAYAAAYDIHGTPLMLANGREVPPLGPLLYALTLVGGDLQAPSFSSLPPPRVR